MVVVVVEPTLVTISTLASPPLKGDLDLDLDLDSGMGDRDTPTPDFREFEPPPTALLTSAAAFPP